MTDHYDTIIIGAGHNGLVAAAYLAKAGKKVLVLERRVAQTIPFENQSGSCGWSPPRARSPRRPKG